LIDNDFDPEVDIVKDANGLWKLAGNKPKLRDDLRKYFSQRNEDGIDIE
jgi:flagellar basal body-associated protein FliL